MTNDDTRDLPPRVDPPLVDVPTIMRDITAALHEFFRHGYGELKITVHEGGVQVDETRRRRYARKKPPARS